MPHKMVIFGGQGLIGSACLRRFQGDPRFSVLAPPRSEVELTDSAAARAYFTKVRPDVVILAAGLVGGIRANAARPADFITRNLAIQLNVFQAALETGVQKLVFFASSCMYPKQAQQPMGEDALWSGPLEPTSQPYAVAKLAGVEMARAYNRQYSAQRFLALLPNSVYGPRDNFDPESGHVLSALMARLHRATVLNEPEILLWGSGKPRREFIHADDVASAVDFLLFSPDVPIPVNLGVGSDLSIRELAEQLAAVIGYRGKILWDESKPDGAMRKLLDNRKLSLLGWRPSVNFSEGLQQTYQWYTRERAHERSQVSISR